MSSDLNLCKSAQCVLVHYDPWVLRFWSLLLCVSIIFPVHFRFIGFGMVQFISLCSLLLGKCWHVSLFLCVKFLSLFFTPFFVRLDLFLRSVLVFSSWFVVLSLSNSVNNRLPHLPAFSLPQLFHISSD